MILLDGLDKPNEHQSPKLVAEIPSSLPIVRTQTPTPSLPDYEASQAQLRPTIQSYPEIQRKRTRRRRCKKFTLYALVVYFVLTVIVGVPVLVIKLKRKVTTKANPYGQTWDDTGPIPPKSITLGDAPLRISSAKSCNNWNVKDRPNGKVFLSELDYTVPVNGSLFLNTNISYASNSSYLDQFSGSLLVAINDDASVTDGRVHVTMQHTSPQLGNATNVCLMETGTGGGIYLFAPQNIRAAEALIFNITLLLPQSNTPPRYIPQLMCHLPHFEHTYRQLDPQIILGTAVLGGALSSVYVESMQAKSAVVKASSAEIRGRFRVSSQLSLETLSAPINADIYLVNDGSAGSPTYMHLTTGNSVLNANVSLYVPPVNATEDDGSYPREPNFLAHAETFNAPLNLAVSHDDGSIPSIVRLRAINNIGKTNVALDSKFAGTFDVNTMFAQADVFTWDGNNFDAHYVIDDDGDDDGDGDGDEQERAKSSDGDDSDSDDTDPTQLQKFNKVWLFLPTSTSQDSETTSSTVGGRCLEYDMISSSQIRGWVGIPPRPPPTSSTSRGNTSHVEVISSLNAAQLVLEP